MEPILISHESYYNQNLTQHENVEDVLSTWSEYASKVAKDKFDDIVFDIEVLKYMFQDEDPDKNDWASQLKLLKTDKDKFATKSRIFLANVNYVHNAGQGRGSLYPITKRFSPEYAPEVGLEWEIIKVICFFAF